MPASMKRHPVVSNTFAIRSSVAGETALHSTNTGFAYASVRGLTNRSATAKACDGGTIERRKSAPAINSRSLFLTSIPARSTRPALAALLPASEVRTCAPYSRRRRPMAVPISPVPTIATVTASECGIDFLRNSVSGRPRPARTDDSELSRLHVFVDLLHFVGGKEACPVRHPFVLSTFHRNDEKIAPVHSVGDRFP